MYNGHLSIEEVDELNQQKGPAENQTHVENCQQCRLLLDKYKAVSAKLEKLMSARIGARNGMNCPDEKVWFDVAARNLPDTEGAKYVQHASECDSCGKKLATAMRLFQEDLTEEEEQALAKLPGASAEAQRKLAERLGGEPGKRNTETVQPKTKWFSWKLFSYSFAMAIIATLVTVGTVRIRQNTELNEVKQLIENDYRAWRPTEYRIAGVPYGPAKNQLGALEKRYVKVTNVKDPRLAAAAALLRMDSNSAIKILEEARTSGDTSAALSDNLVAAYAIEAQRTNSAKYLQLALQLVDDIIQKNPQDTVAYFNRALIYSNLGCADCEQKSRADFERVVNMDHDENWVREAQSKLHGL